MLTSFPVWDATGATILRDHDDREIWMEEQDIRRLIGAQQLGVFRSRNERKIVLKVQQEVVFPRSMRRVEMPPPNCCRVQVSDHHKAFMHVAQRCQGYYDGRPMPLMASGQPRPWRLHAKCL